MLRKLSFESMLESMVRSEGLNPPEASCCSWLLYNQDWLSVMWLAVSVFEKLEALACVQETIACVLAGPDGGPAPHAGAAAGFQRHQRGDVRCGHPVQPDV